ncbi:hypothetical protein PFAG_05868 [Plasmodium falciparum Santa Lucia]|uniref:Uncharacterized protein n=13 Tax=Plasmodium falciparum TaxID=5833 RepID=Q8IK78_PLAF7|nr:conserved Plasmodium protein, unknown function [Plasmodium falciparum 3D7]ETW15637.1 hypothetical protein PFFVO_05417 [Plasmodium falciparum Vietnam Oak-Knoll (FVO)]ETW28863.1 hypothetical protein PFFCH_03723 [Plasmodium falciparum FCH/4]ETW33498.1 hypothetical protein PFTANZ_05746 [Plasmodium falciparum Tanzania (2000708)]ETW40182.1 hypothetical protein PFNF135_05410 [Plasmodium falciparum NF135/5.C10]ETW54436.1 hypothetical protein PFUGPA_04302 [Plasmodium falciparum Palo Alto/Uganda]ETW|eukprot:XP_001348902.1 conserved Plasmodium protein, unknown function [Plasmodium falciparum 3D7]
MFNESDHQINIESLLNQSKELPNLLDPSATENNSLNLYITLFTIIYIYLIIFVGVMITPAISHTISNQHLSHLSTNTLNNDKDEIKQTEIDTFQDIECD